MRKREWERGREKERIPSRLHAASTKPDVEFKPTNCKIMTQAEIKSQSLSQWSHLGMPRENLKNNLLHTREHP